MRYSDVEVNVINKETFKGDCPAVLISHYGDDALLEACLPTIPETSITLVHDANKSGFGFTKAYNGLVYKALGLKDLHCSWFFLLNNDTELSKNCLTNIDKLFKLKEKAGIIGCKIVNIQDKNTIQHAGTRAAIPAGVHKTGFLSEKDFNEDTQERWVTGCAFAISRDCLIECGLFDSRYDLIFQDSDYCYTARSRAFEVWYASEAILFHHGGVSTGKDIDEDQRRRMNQDSVKFAEKWAKSRIWEDLDRETF